MNRSFLNYYDMILLVDDDPLTNHLCQIQLKKNNVDADIITVNNAEDALRSISHLCDHQLSLKILVFLDVNMPIITGWHFLDFLPSIENIDSQKIDVILTSGYIDEERKEKGFESPYVIGVNEKPIVMSKVEGQVLSSKIELQEA